jgi:hypothetical protein
MYKRKSASPVLNVFNLEPHHAVDWGSKGIVPCILNLHYMKALLASRSSRFIEETAPVLIEYKAKWGPVLLWMLGIRG